MNELSDTTPMRGAECFHSSPLREKSYSPKRRISLAHPHLMELSKIPHFELSNPIMQVEAKLSPRTQFQVVGNYDILKTIGKGQFGKVKLARHALTNDLVAVKVINKQKLDNAGKKIFEMEVTVMKKLSHPNIIRLYEVIETDKFYFLFMEYASGGEVLDYIVMHKSLSEKKARNLFRQIISGISHCHKNSIVHRDLKGENLLLDSNLTIKVIDFGLSNKWSTASFLKTACGSPLYASPEIIEHKEYIGPEVDIWSMGVLLYVFLIGLPPFEGDDLLTLYNKILNCDYKIPEDKILSKDCKDILSRILVVDPKSRATMDELVNHPWVKGDDNWQPADLSPPALTVESIDKNLLIQLEYLGYSKETVIDSLLNSKFNAPSAVYHLLQNKRIQQSDYLMSLPSSPSRALKMGSNPISSLQRKRVELEGRRRANSECPEFTIIPITAAQPPPKPRKRSQSRNESQIRQATSHLVNHHNSSYNYPMHPFAQNNLLPAQSNPCNITNNNSTCNNINNTNPKPYNAGRRASACAYGANKINIKHVYKNEIIHDEKDEIKRNTDDNIVFIRTLKDKDRSKLGDSKNVVNNVNNNNNNQVNHSNEERFEKPRVTRTISPVNIVRRPRTSSNPSRAQKIYHNPLIQSSDGDRDEIKQSAHDIVAQSTPYLIQSNVPIVVNPIVDSGNTIMKNYEARRCRSVNVDADKHDHEGPIPGIKFDFLNENKKGSSLTHGALFPSVEQNNNNFSDQPKQLTEVEFEEIKHQLEEEKKHMGTSSNPQASNNWQSFLSWTKQLLQTRDESDKPRSVRTVFNNSLTSNKPPREIVSEIKRVLKSFHMPFEHTSAYSLKAVDPMRKVYFEVEVCQLPKISQMYVRISRISGKWEDYKELCEILVHELDL